MMIVIALPPGLLKVRNRESSILLDLLAVFGTFHRRNTPYDRSAWGDYAKRATKGRADRDELWRSLCQVWHGRLRYQGLDQIKRFMTEAEEVCGIVEVDIDAIKAKAVEEIPKPKGWSKLNADGTPKSRPKGKPKPAARSKAKTPKTKTRKQQRSE